MATVTGAMQAVIRLLNAQDENFIDKGMLPATFYRSRDYAALNMFLQNRSAQETVTAGTDIVSLLNPKVSVAGGPKAPTAPHYQGAGGEPNRMRTALTEYEYATNITWHDLNLNAGDPYTPEGSRKIYDLAEKTNGDFVVGMANDLETDFFATPSAEMFTGDGTGKYPLKSVWTGCNVWEEKHYTGTNGGDGLFPVMTDQQGLDPRDPKFLRYDDQGGKTQLSATKLTYGQAANNDTSANDHLLDRLAELMALMKWSAVPLAEGFAPEVGRKARAIMCSREALSLFNRTNRANGERFATFAPVGQPTAGQDAATFGGLSFITSDTLRNAALYPDVQRTSGLDVSGAEGRDPVDEFSNEGAAGGYYYFLDPDACNLHLHANRAFEMGEWKSMAPLNEDVYRKLAKMLGNIHHRRFITHGILFPSVNIANYAKSA